MAHFNSGRRSAKNFLFFFEERDHLLRTHTLHVSTPHAPPDAPLPALPRHASRGLSLSTFPRPPPTGRTSTFLTLTATRGIGRPSGAGECRSEHFKTACVRLPKPVHHGLLLQRRSRMRWQPAASASVPQDATKPARMPLHAGRSRIGESPAGGRRQHHERHNARGPVSTDSVLSAAGRHP